MSGCRRLSEPTLAPGRVALGLTAMAVLLCSCGVGEQPSGGGPGRLSGVEIEYHPELACPGTGFPDYVHGAADDGSVAWLDVEGDGELDAYAIEGVVYIRAGVIPGWSDDRGWVSVRREDPTSADLVAWDTSIAVRSLQPLFGDELRPLFDSLASGLDAGGPFADDGEPVPFDVSLTPSQGGQGAEIVIVDPDDPSDDTVASIRQMVVRDLGDAETPAIPFDQSEVTAFEDLSAVDHVMASHNGVSGTCFDGDRSCVEGVLGSLTVGEWAAAIEGGDLGPNLAVECP
jgi:hypothetical protein